MGYLFELLGEQSVIEPVYQEEGIGLRGGYANYIWVSVSDITKGLRIFLEDQKKMVYVLLEMGSEIYYSFVDMQAFFLSLASFA